MENEAVKDQDVENPENPEGTGEPEPSTDPGGAGSDADPVEGGEDDPTGDGQEGESDEVDIVREGDTQPQPGATPRGFLKRINKLNTKVETAKQETAEEREKRIHLEDENRFLKVALEQAQGSQPEPLAAPDPGAFDGGHLDPDYVKAHNEYTKKEIQAQVDEGVKKATQQSTVTSAQQAAAHDLEKKQTDHYGRASKLKVKDYEATEDKAIEIFGTENTNHLIANLDNSEVALYYFGKNPEVAQKYSEMLIKQPIKALIEIGGLLSEIKIKPKSEPAPDPDVELEGGAPSNLEAMQTKLNKLRDQARSGKGMDKVLAFKKQMKEKGIELR